MSRIETIARGLIVIGLVAAIVTIVVIGAQRLLGDSNAPELEDLGPLLNEGTALHDRERADLGTEDRPGRSVLLSVPEAVNQEEARSSMLRMLQTSGWLVSSGGGAIPRGGAVCFALSTPTSWLAEPANTAFQAEFEDELQAADEVAIVVDMFFCAKADQ